MKQFSPSYLVRSAYNAAQQRQAARDICAKYNITEFSRAEALRIGMKSGGQLNAEMQALAKKTVPLRSEYEEIFTDLCTRHNVVFEGGIREFLDGAYALRGDFGGVN